MTPKREEQFTILQFEEERSDDNIKHTSFDTDKYAKFRENPKQVIRAEKLT